MKKLVIIAVLFAIACEQEDEVVSFGDDVSFLRKHTDVVVLSDGESQLAVVPLYQGRVMTSTAGGPDGASYGWINRKAIASSDRQPHINVFGGEDRFWLGPEGGQFSIFFAPGDPFDLEHWQVPEPIDWGGWELTSQVEDEACFNKRISLVNHSGTRLQLGVERSVRLLSRPEGLDLDAMKDSRFVAFESINTIINTGPDPWTKESGLLSVWILGMFSPSPKTTIVIPFRPGSEVSLGPIVNDAYFGRVPAERLVVRDDALFFRGDGLYRSKIGIASPRARPVMGSYDESRRLLTLVQYTLPDDATDYVNSMWGIQDEPYRGDVVNSYNDGPPEPGVPPLGPFYELESSSPAATLDPGGRLSHVHRTIHIEGPEDELNAVALTALGVALEAIKAAFP